MIKFSDLKQGDYVLVSTGGEPWQGEVVDLNNDEKQVCINNGVQDFWFSTDDLYPITLNDETLRMMNFEKVANADGSVKYMKDAFRVLIPREGEFSQFEIWYRDETRQIVSPIFLHQLQNHYLDMTKVHLTNAPE